MQAPSSARWSCFMDNWSIPRVWGSSKLPYGINILTLSLSIIHTPNCPVGQATLIVYKYYPLLKWISILLYIHASPKSGIDWWINKIPVGVPQREAVMDGGTVYLVYSESNLTGVRQNAPTDHIWQNSAHKYASYCMETNQPITMAISLLSTSL